MKKPLSEYDKKVLACITTERPEGVPNFHIMQWDFGGGRDISQSLQKLKRRGLAIIVRKNHGVTYWRAT